MKMILHFITWPAVAGILAAIVMLQWTNRQQPMEPVAPATGVASFATAVQRAVPSVVNIYTSTRLPARGNQYPENPHARHLQRSLGSGVIVSNAGLVLTSRHIISNADEILVLLHDGRSGLAKVIGSDPDTDLAVLKIGLDNIQAIEPGNPNLARVGDIVLAIGNPYGFNHSVSQGIISAMGRHGLNLNTYEDFIQTDAAINQGNSGGALIDSEGRLLGINAATYSRSGESTGIGLATPMDLAMDVAADLVNFGKVIRGWMGLEVQGVLLSDKQRPSLLVTRAHPQGPAAHSGIHEGDVITHIDRQPIVDGHATMHQIALLRPGDAVDVSVRRDQQEITLKVIVGVKPEPLRDQ